MTKQEFIALGLDEALATKCETASKEELKKFIPKDRFDEVNNAKGTLETQLNERDKQLENLKKSTGDTEALKAEITRLQGENKTQADNHKAEMHQLKVNSAVDAALANAKAINVTAVKPFLKDLDKADFNDDGTVKGLADQLKQLTKAEDTKFLFKNDDKPSIKGAKVGEPGDNPATGDDISKMNYTELSAYLAQNPNVSI